MAYELHIEREGGAISQTEWLAALDTVAGVRHRVEDTVATNPTTGEEIRISRTEGDAEVQFSIGGFLGLGRRDEWRPVFRFSGGRASFGATPEVGSPKNAVRRAAAELASVLDAKIVGDEGEIYYW